MHPWTPPLRYSDVSEELDKVEAAIDEISWSCGGLPPDRERRPPVDAAA
jgi:hypothetical protein